MTLSELDALYGVVDDKRISEFISSVHKAYANRDFPVLDLVGFLDRVVDGFLPEGRILCRQESLTPEEKSRISVHGLITAAEMLILCDTRSCVNLGEKARAFLELSSRVVMSDYPFAETAVKTLSGEITSVGFTWAILEKAVTLDIPVFHFCNSVKFSKKATPFLYAKHGIVECKEGRFMLSPADTKGSPSRAFGVFSDSIEVVTRKVNGERLKSSDREDPQALYDFAESFIEIQSQPVRQEQEARRLEDGDYVDIECFYDSRGRILFRVIDDEIDMVGTLMEEEVIRGIYTHDLLDYLAEGDCICDAELVLSGGDVQFSIRDAYTRFCKREAESDLRAGLEFEGRALRVLDGIERINWITVRGYGGVSKMMEGVRVGDKVRLEVDNLKETVGFFINVRQPKYISDSPFLRFAVGEEEGYDVLAHFVLTRKQVLAKREGEKEGMEDHYSFEESALKSLSRTVLHRVSSCGSWEHCYRLITALFLAKAAGDEDLFLSVRLEFQYMLHLLSFATNQDLRVPNMEDQIPERAQLMLRCLGFASSDSGREGLMNLASSNDPLIRSVATLLLSSYLSSEFEDEIKVDRDAVREKVCRLLGMGDIFVREGTARAGKYGSVEHGDVEFKSSYVFRNDSKVPVADIAFQGRGQVFEAVCAFLNTDGGGTVYVGVNDSGNPIKDENWGVNADIKWLKDHYDSVSRERIAILHHGITKVENMDSMARFLLNEKELYFKDTLHDLIEIEPTEDGDAIRIKVSPSRFEIAYLYKNSKALEGGVVFKRSGGSTLQMTDHDKRMRLLELKDINREMGFVVTIREAIDKHQKLMFKNYSSSNSAKVQDRLVVPVNLFYNDENVYCYDLGTKTYKQFRLHRIESIEKLDDFYTLPLRPARDCDVFRWLDEGKGKFHIRLRMKVAAKNYLFEEYSCAEKLPEEQLRKDGRDHWILDTTLYGLGAVRRFYLGLADQIEILDSEDKEKLLKEISRFVASNITNQPDEGSVQ